jgi:hypothetical protein
MKNLVRRMVRDLGQTDTDSSDEAKKS